ncbi:MAG TPA: type II secretion system protein GspJ [Spirochaetota bacterium]|nr:type II secretion system protein GspJ [Spirochaetota bacterium]HPJ36813.1 type II secretion system protein GspJ [Spirochaetota bacterium]HPQ53831.1 type II secretion system protein GspJ [Spirochaetota bacterium]
MNTVLSKYYRKQRTISLSCNKGFSVLEMLVATAVASIILLMVYTAHHAIMDSINHLTNVSAFYETVNIAVARIDSDISCTYINKYNKKLVFTSRNNRGAPYEGKINFVTIDYQKFSMLGNPRKEYPFSDIREISYYLKSSPDQSGTTGTYKLIRREDRYYDEDSESGGKECVMLENVRDIRFEFKLRNDWTDSWDSKSNNKFPTAVKTTVVLQNYKGKEESFIFISRINMAE